MQMSNDKRRISDLNQKGFVIMLEHYPNDSDYAKYLYLAVEHVTVNPRLNVLTSTPLNQIPCDEITFEGKKIKYAQECIVFNDQTIIGENPGDGFKSYIQVTVHPCKSACFKDPSDPDFVEGLKDFFSKYFFYIKFLDSYSNMEDYKKPLG